MPTRHHRQDRCPACGLRMHLCVCDHAPRLETKTRVVVLIHPKELATTSNTGRLIPLALTRGEQRLRGGRERLDTTGIQEPGQRLLLLFPGPNSVPLDTNFTEQHPGPYTLVVPDGTWNQAKKVGKREPSLSSATWVQLVNPGISGYKLRKAPRPGSLCTLEAVARALGVLESPEIERDLVTFLKYFVERNMAARQVPPGTLPLSQK